MLVMLTIIPCERTNEVNVTPAIGRIHSLHQLPTNMREGCRVALSGTPGTGKTTISSLLQSEGFDVLSLEKIADKHNCLGELDASDDSKPIDIELLISILRNAWDIMPENITIIDGHLSHLLPCDHTIILRCKPDVLENRLVKRGYAKGKIQGNVEWELIGSAWNDNEDRDGWLELDTTELTENELKERIIKWIADDFKPNASDTDIDWIASMEE
jgi:adenylate kinase